MKRGILIVIVCSLIIGCSNNKIFEEKSVTEVTTTKQADFWKWFSSNSKKLFDYEDNRNEIFSELSVELKKVHPDLTFAFGPVESDVREFIVSADGNRKVFDEVIELTKCAPKFKEWKIISFRPRVNAESPVVYNGLRVDGKDVRFTYEANNETKKIDLILYVKDLDSNDQRYYSCAFLLLDHAIGEYDVETKVGYIEMKNLSTSGKGKMELLQFKELPKIVDSNFR